MFARDAYNVLVAQLTTAVSGMRPAPAVKIGWPPERLLAQIAKGDEPPLVSVYDPGFSRDASRFMPFTANEIVVTSGITSNLSQPLLSTTITVTLGGTVMVNDAVSLILGRDRSFAAAIATAALTDSLSTMAVQLAANINADETLSQWVTASANGAVVTVTNTTGSLLRAASNVGNIGTSYRETHRLSRDVRVDVWTATDAQRVAVARLIEQRLAYLDVRFGAQGNGTTDDGTWVRIRYLGDRFIDDDVYRDIYRWMFRSSLEYGQTYAETLYSVLAFLPRQQAEVGADDFETVVTL